MSDQSEELSGQTLALPVILTSHIKFHLHVAAKYSKVQKNKLF